jgi:hypothetical protein
VDVVSSISKSFPAFMHWFYSIIEGKAASKLTVKDLCGPYYYSTNFDLKFFWPSIKIIS